LEEKGVSIPIIDMEKNEKRIALPGEADKTPK